MKNRLTLAANKNDLSVDLTFHGLSASLVSEFAEKIVKPYYNNNLTDAFQDLICKALAELEGSLTLNECSCSGGYLAKSAQSLNKGGRSLQATSNPGGAKPRRKLPKTPQVIN